MADLDLYGSINNCNYFMIFLTGPVSSPTLGATRHFPATRVLTENIPDASKLIKKITEHNASVNENTRLSAGELAHFEKIANKVTKWFKVAVTIVTVTSVTLVTLES